MRSEVLAVVPARGGSKSIPRKNAYPLAGHSLIAYSIAAGLNARTVCRVIVSTDDPDLAAIARDYGAEVPFLRPPELAQDDTPDLPVFQHVLDFLKEKEAYEPDVIVQLRPTSPLRPVDLVDQAVETLLSHPGASSVRSVTVAKQTPYKMWRLKEEGLLRPLLETEEMDEPYNMPRQSLPEVLWQTGHIDVFSRETIFRSASLTGRRILPIQVDPHYCVDIDIESDMTFAEWLLRRGSYAGVRPPNRSSRTTPHERRPLPSPLSLIVLDFDGVLTDDRVWVREDGTESVACNRRDGLGIEMLRRRGIETLVLSKERNPVVGARCSKLGIRCFQGIEDKYAVLRSLAAERDVGLGSVVYVGNDVNDLECLVEAGCGVAVADAHPEVLRQADLILKTPGGKGAVRELCDLVLALGDARTVA